jgi:hypothetical protein
VGARAAVVADGCPASRLASHARRNHTRGRWQESERIADELLSSGVGYLQSIVIEHVPAERKGIAAFDNTSATIVLKLSVPKLVTVSVIMPSEAGPLP